MDNSLPSYEDFDKHADMLDEFIMKHRFVSESLCENS